MGVALEDPPELWAGDALDLIEPAVATVEPGQLPCVLSTWMLAYLSRERRAELHDSLDVLGRGRRLAWITAEYEANVPWLGTAGRRAALDVGQLPTRLGLELWDHGPSQTVSLAWMHAHGQWLEWLEDPS